MSNFTGIPQRTPLVTPIDSIADLLNTHRLPGESLIEFKYRVLDVYVNRANSTYTGLYNGIARELGQNNYSGGIIIDAIRDGDGHPVNYNGSVTITDRYVTLYEHLDNETIDLELDITKRTDSYFVSDLISNINTSTVFEASTWGTISDWDRSSYLKKIKSRRRLMNKVLNGEDLHTYYDVLKDGNFITGSPVFSNPLLITPVRDAEPTVESEYEVSDRFIKTYGYPQGTVSFYWESLPLVVPISTVSLHQFHSSEFMDLLTEQIRVNSTITEDGIPTPEGARYINELLSIYPLGYGT